MMGQLVMRRVLPFLSALALAWVGVAGSANAQTCTTTVGVDDANAANDIINTSTTWSGTVCLEAPIFVNVGAVLTIQPGTIVRGQPRQAVAGALPGSPGALVVTQGAKIIADGSPQAPIVMTTGAMDNDSDGVCDNFDADAFLDDYPGYDPASLPALVADATPTFCDDTPTTAPMPPLNANGVQNVSMWGGFVLLGRAPTNLANEQATPSGHGTGFLEGVTLPGVTPNDAVCGGVEPHDSSGIVRYVSVRHAGDELGAGNELNGVTLCGVGDNTIFEFNEVYANFDDGFEWFGGTVHANHLVVTYVGDDLLDIDWGYTGSIQFAFTLATFFNQDGGAVFGSLGGDKQGELDGDDYLNNDNTNIDRNVNVRTAYSAAVFAGDALAQAVDSREKTPWPLSGAYIANWTGIGAVPDGGNPAVAPSTGPRLGVQMRQGFAGQVVNSVFVNTSNPCHVVSTSTGQAPAGHDATTHVTLGLARWITNSCDGSSALAAGVGAATGSADQGDTFSQFDTGATACALNIRATGGGFAGLVDENPNFNAKTLTGGGYDPRPAGAGADCGVTPRLPGLDRVNYRGAFVAGAPLWTDGWTVLDQAGAL